MFVVLVPGVAVQAGGGVLEALGHLDHLPRGVVEPGSVAGQPPHLRQERDAHISVVDPERDRQRARPGQRAVGHAHLLVRNEIGDGVDGGAVARVLFLGVGLDECRSDGAAIVQRAHVQQLSEAMRRRAELGRLLAEVVQVVEYEVEVLERVVLIAGVAGHLRRQQHSGEHHPHGIIPVVELAAARVECGGLDGPRKVRDRLSRPGVDDAVLSGSDEVVADAVERGFDIGLGRHHVVHAGSERRLRERRIAAARRLRLRGRHKKQRRQWNSSRVLCQIH